MIHLVFVKIKLHASALSCFSFFDGQACFELVLAKA